MSEKKLGPSDFQAEVERLRAAGKLPSLEEVLDAVAETREKYPPKILEAPKQSARLFGVAAPLFVARCLAMFCRFRLVFSD